MTYRVVITRGYGEPDGTTIFGDIGLDRLTAAGILLHLNEKPRSGLGPAWRRPRSV